VKAVVMKATMLSGSAVNWARVWTGALLASASRSAPASTLAAPDPPAQQSAINNRPTDALSTMPANC
jgi:hypothetical protein